MCAYGPLITECHSDNEGGGVTARFNCGMTWLMHPDPRSGCDERSSQCSNELLSVPDMRIRHPMQHARKVRWQTPVTEAPHLCGRSLRSDPQPLRAHRPLIMMMRAMPGGVVDVGSLGSSTGRLEHG